MESRQLGQSEYNDAILSIYGGNPVASIAGSYKPPEQPQLPKNKESKGESKTVKTGDLYRETRGLLLAAKKNLQLKKRILKYETARFKQLTVDLAATLKSPEKEKKKKKKELTQKQKDSKTSIRGWMKKLFQDALKRIKDRLKKALKDFLLKKYKKLNPKQRARIRKAKKFIDKQRRRLDKFKKRGGFRGFATRRLKSLGTRIIGTRNAARLRLFRQTGGVKGAARRAFFSGVRNVTQLAKSAKGLAQVALGPISGQAAKTGATQVAKGAATQTAAQAGKGAVVRTARNAVVGLLGRSGSKELLKLTKNYISPIIKKIPIFGALLDFLINVFIFKESPGRAAFKSIGAGLFAWIGGAMGAVGGPAAVVTVPAGAILGGWLGDTLGGLLYDAIFGGGDSKKKEEQKPSKEDTASAERLKDLEVQGYADGGKVPGKPQIVLVGEGGEEEWIVPKSKLLEWLGSKTAINLLNLGAFDVISTSKAFLKAMGVSTSDVPETPADAPKGEVASNIKVKKPNAIGDFGKKIVKFIIKGFELIRDMFKGVLEKFRSFLPDLSKLSGPVKALVQGAANRVGGAFAALVGFLLGGGAAQAATTGGGNTPGTALTGGGYEYTDPNTETTITVTSRYGMRTHPIYGTAKMHGGTDISAASGTPLRAFSDGQIVDSDSLGRKGWGNFLVFKDDKGIFHLYGHMQGGYKRGGNVKKGDVIGKVGSTGASTGPHLHWEAGTGWNGSVITGKFDPLSRYTAQQPFFTAADKKDDKKDDKKPATATTPAKPKPPVRTSSSSKGSTSQYRGGPNRSGKPIATAPLNKKDTASALEKYGTMDEDNNQQVAVIEVPVTRTVTVPMPLPLQTASVGSSGNTPAWGQGAVRGA